MSPLGKAVLVASVACFCLVSTHATAQTDKDPDRPACTTDACRKARTFVKAHYCGESPAGNGPDDSCEIKRPKKPSTGVDVVADYKCEWNERKQQADCEQHGQPSTLVRRILIDELHHLGLPVDAKGQTWFTVWKSSRLGWSLADAYYSRQSGDDLWLCQVIAVIDHNSHAIVIDKLPFQKTDIDTPDVTQWAPVDITDVGGTGHDDIVLEGDAYEDHWLQVLSVHDGTVRTIFSGLGYYL
jgi:hypothetical protein